MTEFSILFEMINGTPYLWVARGVKYFNKIKPQLSGTSLLKKIWKLNVIVIFLEIIFTTTGN